VKKLVEFYDGEPWFDNPLLVTANGRPQKGKRKMAKRTRKRAKARKNFYGAGLLANRPKRRHRRARTNTYMAMNRRRRYRRNPAIAGFQVPPMEEVFFTVAGLVAPNLAAQQLLRILPASLTGSTIGTWAVKAASVLLPSMAVSKFVNPRAGKLFLVGGVAGLTMDAIRTFAPGIVPGLGYQPLLGSYFSRPVAGRLQPYPAPARSMLPTTMIADAPDRLSPTSRF